MVKIDEAHLIIVDFIQKHKRSLNMNSAKILEVVAKWLAQLWLGENLLDTTIYFTKKRRVPSF